MIAPACAHPWVSSQAATALRNRITPRAAGRMIDPRCGHLSAELMRVARDLRDVEDRYTCGARQHPDRAYSSDMMRQTLSCELIFYLELQTDGLGERSLTGRPCFLGHSDPYVRAALTICFLYVISLRAAQHSGPVPARDPDMGQLCDLLRIGNYAALDRETHVVRACLLRYSEHVERMINAD
ncbi:hypothetical protein CYMTET_19026 [Cymbomonas tetramitiformis]|uniref:Uncharacterized protein n=1 Tax=Cymbomonas tetramitiformis TaxID=36881 RepID=A0AAE0L5D0_9CHLO|nr:hypothetical protein CYMTET_19026 [Cymbomonas tetramitiformis]|eukprot:gene18433-21993_t